MTTLEYRQEVGRRLRKARKFCKMSQGKLAAKAGITPATVSILETGAGGPTVGTLQKLGAALGVWPGCFLPGPGADEVRQFPGLDHKRRKR